MKYLHHLPNSSDDARPPYFVLVVRLRRALGASDGAVVGVRTVRLAKQGLQADERWLRRTEGKYSFRGPHGRIR